MKANLTNFNSVVDGTIRRFTCTRDGKNLVVRILLSVLYGCHIHTQRPVAARWDNESQTLTLRQTELGRDKMYSLEDEGDYQVLTLPWVGNMNIPENNIYTNTFHPVPEKRAVLIFLKEGVPS